MPVLSTIGAAAARGFGWLYRAATGASAGSLWTWGINNSGQLGQGDSTFRLSPTKVGSLSTWTSVSMSQHCLAMQTGGTLWSWGGNFYGQLGQGDTTERNSPVQIGALTTWASAEANTFDSFAVRTNGTLWAWGLNIFGELGLGDTSARSSPVQVGSLTNWATAGYGVAEYASYAIKTNGTLWSWGYGNPDGLDAYGTPYYTDPRATVYPKANRSSPAQVGTGTNWASVAFGQTHALVLTTSGTLWAWGANFYGECGRDDVNNPEWYYYYPLYGECSGGGLSSYYVRYTGPVADGNFPNVLDSSSNCTSAETGVTIDVQYRAPNTIKWGFSSPVQVGSLTSWVQAAAGNTFSVAVRSNGSLWSWGLNTNGQLGLGNTLTQYSSPTQVGSLLNWAYVKCGWSSVIAVKTDGTLWTWGDGNFSGTGTSSPVQVGSATTWIKEIDSLSVSRRPWGSAGLAWAVLSTA